MKTRKSSVAIAAVGSVILLIIFTLFAGVTYNYFRGKYVDQERSKIVEEAKSKFVEECVRANVAEKSCRENEVKTGGAESEGYPEWIVSIETTDKSYKADMLGKVDGDRVDIYQYKRY